MAFLCSVRRAIAAGLLLLAGLVASSALRAEPARAGIDVDVSNGYARLVFTLSDDVEASTSLAGNILIVNFSKPVILPVERLAAHAPDYVSTARRDPDGKAVRVALARKVTVHAIPAAEKFFVDLLPDTWTGEPPGLPQEMIEDLARRAREAERLQRLERQTAEQKKLAPVRVRVARLPTLMRYVFDVLDVTTVAADRAADRLTLTFDAPITFDLADAAAALPAAITGIAAEVEEHSALVRFSFLAKVDVRTFRDGRSYVVDVIGAAARPAERAGAVESSPPDMTVPTTPSEKPARTSAAPIALEPPPSHAEERESAAVRPDLATPPASTAPWSPTEKSSAAGTGAASPSPAASTLAVAETAVPNAAAAVLPSSPAPQAPATATEAPVAPAVRPAVPAAPPTAAEPVDADAAPLPARIHKEGDAVAVDLIRHGANLTLSFPFKTATATAVFQRADVLWIVFDSKAAIDLGALDGEASRTIRAAALTRAPDADIVRVQLDRPHLVGIAADGPLWTVTIGDTIPDPPRALEMTRHMTGANRASASIAFEQPHQLHRIDDPDVGDQLLVVTAFAPARGFLNGQDLVEFRTLASTHGVAIVPLADDIGVALTADKVVISRPNGLTLSSSLQSVLHGSGLRATMFDSQLWGRDRQSTYNERQAHLAALAAAAPPSRRLASRLDLARFYIARDMYAEAKGVLDVALADEHAAARDASANVLRAITEVMMNRPDEALKDLANPAVGDQHDAPLWRALAYARQGKWAQAREGFKRAEAAVATLPIELQRMALMDEIRAAIEVGDFAGAADDLNDFETIGVPPEMQPAISVLIGRLSEGLGRSVDALGAYRAAADSADRPAAAQARLRETALRYGLGDLKREEVISELETLTTVWRGDETEVEALQMLARLYTEEGRFRDSFYVMRSAMAAHPYWDTAHRIQEEAAVTFESLFLAGKGDALPAVEALALFYDFRELTPVGRRGDEMIRRLAERLAAVDLLDQAADLLQYQVDHRLQGAARAQVATRLAIVYLMNHKPDRALATLEATRTGDVANELRNQRLLLQARALSDLGRHDVALEVIAHVEGREAVRLRADILWAARRWSPAAEQIELLYGDRWKEWQPLSDVERADILRAAIGYALGDDTLGLGRFRERYAAKMAQTPDARVFEIVAAPLGASGTEFRDIAHAAASADTLDAFLREMQTRYPEASPLPATPSAAAATSGTGTAAGAPGAGSARSPATGSPPGGPSPSRAAGRSAQLSSAKSE
jgi:tetratricopeptide (TPR) repeat protein